MKRYVTPKVIQRKFIAQDVMSFKEGSESCAINVFVMKTVPKASINFVQLPKLFDQAPRARSACTAWVLV